ncbi:MAG: DUF3352 domain-containing protein [Planctomycetota bacterium]
MFSKRCVWLFVIFLCMLSALLSVKICFSQEEPQSEPAPVTQTIPVERYLPQESIAFFTIRDAKLLSEYWKTGFIYKLWQEPEIKELAAKIKKEFDEGYAEAEKEIKRELGITFDEIFSVFQGEVAFSLIKLDVTTLMMQDPAGIDFVISIDAGEKKDVLKQIIEKMLTSLIEQAGQDNPPSSTSFQYKNQVINSFGNQVFSLLHMFLGTRFFLGLNRKTFEGIVDRYNSAVPQNSLESNENFKQIRNNCRAKGSEIFFVYYDINTFMNSLKAILPPDQSGIFNDMGLLSMKGGGMASYLDKEIVSDVFYTYVPGERKGFYKALSVEGTIDTKLYFPENEVIVLSSGLMNLDACWQYAMQEISKIAAQQGIELLSELKKFEENMGFSIDKDLLPGLSNNHSFYVAMPESGGPFPEIAILLGVKDKQKLSDCINKVVAKLGDITKRVMYEGCVINYIDISSLLQTPQGTCPITPSFMVTDKYLIFAGNPQTIKKIAANFSKDLTPSGTIKELITNMPQNTTGLFYINLAKRSGYLYNTITPFLKNVPGLEIDLGALPEAKTITKCFGTITGYQTVDKDGMQNRITSTSGPTIVSLYVSAIAAAIIIPNMMRAQDIIDVDEQVDQDALAVSRLRVLHLAQEAYKADKSAYAETLLQLKQAEMIDEKLAAGQVGKYIFVLTLDAPTKWHAVAKPKGFGRYYYVDETGVVKWSYSEDVGPDSLPVEEEKDQEPDDENDGIKEGDNGDSGEENGIEEDENGCSD